MTNYQSAVKRIHAATNETELRRVERSMGNLYNIGIFTVPEFVKICDKILDQYVSFEFEEA
jgi:hypothetical protein